MSDIDLTSGQWRELVFEGRNKEFGAYEIRRTSARRHNLAMVIVTVVAVIGFSLPTLIRMVTPQQEKIVMTEVTTLSKLPPAEVKNNDEIKKVNIPPPPLKSSIKFTPPVIKKDEEVKENEEIKSQEELTNTKMAISIADVKGNDEINGKDVAELREVAQETPPPAVEKPFISVEQMPEFPGGQKALLKYLGSNVHYPVIAAENGVQGRVVVRFVVSKTGEIGSVEILQKLDRSCDEEAVRVIKSMPKWIPGKQNGVAVPVYFVVPVVFQLQ